MGGRYKTLVSFAALSAVPLGLASAQTAQPAGQVPQAQVPQAKPPAAAPAATPTAEAPPAPVVYPPLAWTPRDAEELLAFIQTIAVEGLNPLDYDPAGLAAALQTGSIPAISQAASDRFTRVANDLALGHVPRAARDGWHIVDKDLNEERRHLLMRTALEQHRVGDSLRGLLPTHPQYGALKNALQVTPKTEQAKLNRIRLNMDRWRWLPRDLGDRYIIVNVPAYHVALVEGGETQWRQKAIAGAVRTPTPMISAVASGVILNPWWEVPKSIEPEVRGRPGYVPVKGKDGKVQRWRQPPGPANALGQVKFVMYNPQAIYLHDTNARSRFNSQVRSLSHGCIRTQNILDLSAKLLAADGGEWDRAKVDATLKSGKSVQANFVKPLPVYIVYFSSAAALDGKIIDYADIYKRDAKVMSALLDGPTKTQLATR
jgi:murein L,D-transpeptidase YcbB/YkuD